MVEIKKKSECSGCGACASVCSLKAIELKEDEEGFLYPNVNKDKCVECRKCEKICPIYQSKNVNEKEEPPLSLAAYTNDEAIRNLSSSGGIFTEIATYIIENGGVVFGVAFNENFEAFHMAVDTIDGLDKIRGSKYVQSKIGDTYIKAKEYLDLGRTVLYTGTPCQIGGLHIFLGKKYDNLYTQDLICHGVPSPLVWREYVKYREKKAASKTRRTFFRHKKYGWKMFSVQFEFTNCTEYIQTITDDLYMRSFMQNLCLRPSCHHCAFKTKNRLSDITLADFWGIDKLYPDMDDDKGTSLVLIHSEKGKELLEKISERIKYSEVDFEKAIKHNSAMINSSPQNKDRLDFINAVSRNGFRGGEKYVKTKFITRLKRSIKSMIKGIVRR